MYLYRTVSGRISNRSTSVTPKIPAKVSLHNSADLHNDTASSGSHVLDQTQSTLHYGNDETMEIHSESSVSGSRSLNSPKLERIQSQEEDVPRPEVGEFVHEEVDDKEDAMVTMETQDQGACSNIFTNLLTTNLDDVVVNESYNIDIIETAHASSANQNVNDNDDSASHDEYASHDENLSHDEYASSHDENLSHDEYASSHDENLSHDDASHGDNFSQASQASYHLDSCDTESYDQSNSTSLPSELKFSSLDRSDSMSLPSDVKCQSFDQSDSIHSGLSEDDLLEGEKLYLQSLTNIGDGDVDDFVDNVVEPFLFDAQTKSLLVSAKSTDSVPVTSESLPDKTASSTDEIRATNAETVESNNGKNQLENLPVSGDNITDMSSISNVLGEISSSKFQDVTESQGPAESEGNRPPPTLKHKRVYDLEENDFPYIDDSQDEMEPSSCILATVDSDEEMNRKVSTDSDTSCLPNGTAVVYSAEPIISHDIDSTKGTENDISEKGIIDDENVKTDEKDQTGQTEQSNSADMIDDIPYYLHRRHIEGDIKRKKETELFTALANVLSSSSSSSPTRSPSRPGRSLKRPQNMQIQQLKADEIPFQPPPNSAAKRTPSNSPGRSPGRISPGNLRLDFSAEGRRSRKISGSSHSRSPSGGRNRMEVINYHKLPRKDNFSSVDDTTSPPKEKDILSHVPKVKANTTQDSPLKEKDILSHVPKVKANTTQDSQTDNKTTNAIKNDVVRKKKNGSYNRQKPVGKIMKQDSVVSDGSVDIANDDVEKNYVSNSLIEPVAPESDSSNEKVKVESVSKKGSSELTTKTGVRDKKVDRVTNLASVDLKRFNPNNSAYYECYANQVCDTTNRTELPAYITEMTDFELMKENNLGEIATDSLTRHSAAFRKPKPKLSELKTKNKTYEEEEWESLIQQLRKEDDLSPDDLQPSDLLRPLDETVRKKHVGRTPGDIPFQPPGSAFLKDDKKHCFDLYSDMEPDLSYTAASILLSQSYYQNYTTHHDCVDSSFPTFKSTPSASPMGSRSSTSLSSLGDSSGAITMSLSHDTEDIQMEEKSLVDLAFDIQEIDCGDLSVPHHAVIRRNLSPCRLKEYTAQSCKEVRVQGQSSEDEISDMVRKRHSYHGETKESTITKQRRKLLEPKRVSFHETVEEIQSEPYPSSSSSDEKQSDKDKDSEMESPDISMSKTNSDICDSADSGVGDNSSRQFVEGIDRDDLLDSVKTPRREEDSDSSRASSFGGKSGSESDDESECSEGGDLDKSNEFLKFARSLADSGKESTADSGVGDSMTNTTEPSPSEPLKIEHVKDCHGQDAELLKNVNGTIEPSIEAHKLAADSYEDISSSSSGSDLIVGETDKRPSIDPLESLEQLHDSYVSSDEESFEGEATVETD